ncbi:MAG: hypothetical protein KAJ47_03795, partial [Candidatus Aenigmarchaeota archaeon]|nr:hypothetical protein [Candidatus Aenigmarchaeota archaeon]
MMAVRKKKKAQTGFVRALLLCVLIIAVVGGLFIVPMGNKLYDALSGYMFPSFAQEGCGDRAEDSIDALVFAIDCTALQAHKDESGDDTEFTDYGCPETDEKIKFGSTAYVQNSSDDPYYHVHNLDISQDFKEDISGSLFRHAINFARGYGAPECIVYYEQFPQEEMDQWKMDPNRISWAAIGTSATIGLAGEGFSALKYIGKGVKAVGSGTKGVVKATASIGSKDFINFGVKIRSHIDNAMIKKIEKESIMSIVTGSGRVTEETLISMYKFGADRILRLTGTAAEIPAKIALEVSSAAVDDALKGYLTKDKIKKIFKNELSSEASSIMLEKEIYTEITEISQLELVKDVGFFEAKKDMDLTWDISLENEITAQADAIFKADGDVCKGVYASVTNNVKITDLVKAKSITGDGSEVVTEKLANAVNIAYAMKEKSWLRKAMEFAHILKKQKEAKIDWDNANKVIEKQYNKLRGLQIDDPTTAKKVALYGTYLGDAALHTTSGKIMISDNIGYIWDATIAEQKEWEEFIDCSGIDDDEGNKIHVLGNSDSYCHDEFVEIEEYMPDGKSIEAFGKCFVMKTYVGRVGCITAVAIGVSAQEIYDETLRMTPVGINAIGNMQV